MPLDVLGDALGIDFDWAGAPVPGLDGAQFAVGDQAHDSHARSTQGVAGIRDADGPHAAYTESPA